MTARQKLLNAFESAGTSEIGVAACYEGIFIRDHWFSLTDIPWWFARSGIVDKEIAWTADVVEKSGLEWLTVHPCPSRAERARREYEQRDEGVWLLDAGTGTETLLPAPTPGGTNTSSAVSRHSPLDSLPATRKEIDAIIPVAAPFDRAGFLGEGRHDSAAAVRKAFDLLLYSPISSPLWSLYGLLGYEGMMVFLAQDGHLASYTGERILQNVRQSIRMISALGADAVWIEECLTDQISPDLFRVLNVPLVQQCVEEIRLQGMKSIYYYCGDPNDRLDAIMDIGADAIHFEESKKRFVIDIADIVRKVDRRCLVFGNLDSIGVLEAGSEQEIRAEIRRQFDAGGRNENRFILSTGSPITPGTSVERVRMYTDVARELSSR